MPANTTANTITKVRFARLMHGKEHIPGRDDPDEAPTHDRMVHKRHQRRFAGVQRLERALWAGDQRHRSELIGPIERRSESLGRWMRQYRAVGVEHDHLATEAVSGSNEKLPDQRFTNIDAYRTTQPFARCRVVPDDDGKIVLVAAGTRNVAIGAVAANVRDNLQQLGVVKLFDRDRARLGRVHHPVAIVVHNDRIDDRV